MAALHCNAGDEPAGSSACFRCSARPALAVWRTEAEIDADESFDEMCMHTNAR